ncbi:MAG: purine-nucleoside phosphorylase [Clostridium sp.]|nr:purine-nucleoside phosphorylase [Clostridium sp.]
MSTVDEKKIPTPHIEAGAGEIAETILLPGDPLRAKFIAEKFLTDPKCFNEKRGMLGFTGEYRGKRISVMGTGMGCPSMGIYSYELINFYGCRNLIRVGTAGAMREDVHVRDLVFAMGSCTDSAYLTQFRLPGQFAPTADYTLLRTAVEAAEKRGANYHVGNVHCSDVFYGAAKPEIGVQWKDMGVLAVEMESAALYANAAYGGARALALMTISDSLVTGEVTTAEEREKTFVEMMEVALETAAAVTD